MPPLAVGERVPKVRLVESSGAVRSLADWKGTSVLVMFYPEAGSPGCTKQVCGYRDLTDAFAELGIELMGVSPDGPDEIKAFEREHRLGFTLLADEPGSDGVPPGASAFGVWGEKKLYGKTYVGLIRSAFLIGPDQRVVRAWMNVKATGQAERVLKELRAPEQGAAVSKSEPNRRATKRASARASTRATGR